MEDIVVEEADISDREMLPIPGVSRDPGQLGPVPAPVSFQDLSAAVGRDVDDNPGIHRDDLSGEVDDRLGVSSCDNEETTDFLDVALVLAAGDVATAEFLRFPVVLHTVVQ